MSRKWGRYLKTTCIGRRYYYDMYSTLWVQELKACEHAFLSIVWRLWLRLRYHEQPNILFLHFFPDPIAQYLKEYTENPASCHPSPQSPSHSCPQSRRPSPLASSSCFPMRAETASRYCRPAAIMSDTPTPRHGPGSSVVCPCYDRYSMKRHR
jgi:hypothetical protein